MHSLTSFFVAVLAVVHGVASLQPARYDRRVIARNPVPTVVSPVYLGVRQENSSEVKSAGSAVVPVASSSEIKSVTKASSTPAVTRTLSLTRSRISPSARPQTSSAVVGVPSSVKVTVPSAPKPTEDSTGPVVVDIPAPVDVAPVVNVGDANSTPSGTESQANSAASSPGNAAVVPSPSSPSSNSPVVQGAIAPDPSSSSASASQPSESAQGEAPTTPSASGNLDSSKKNMPFIVGGVIGGLVVAVLIIAAIILWCRRTREKESGEFRDLMWRRQSANLFFSAVTPPSMSQTSGPSHTRDPSLSTSRIPSYSFHEQYSGDGSSADIEPVSIPRQQLTVPHAPTHPTPLYQSFTVQPPVITTTPPSPPQSTGIALPNGDTTRQAELKRQIADLQMMLANVGTQGAGPEMSSTTAIGERIAFLQGLMNSPWALGQTAVVPDGVYL